MTFTLDADTKERIRAATDIVDLVGGFIELRRQGRGFVALCPWHRDRRPSLQINPERQTWKCWVCDIGGDVFNFVMQYENMGFPEALRFLAERAGIPLTNLPAGKKPDFQNSQEKETLFRVMAWASRLYHQYLLKSPEGEKARQYLDQRGITEASIAGFEIGLSPNSWSFLADQVQAAGYTVRHLEATGLCGRSERGSIYDRFRDRVMFPIRDTQKRIIAFGGRVLPGSTESAKYINSPESRIFTKNQHLYGLDVARDTIRERKQAIVMEGYTDVIIAHQAGLSSSVAVLGTALGANHLKLLQRSMCDQVVLLLDGDEAGQRRSDEVLELFLNAQMDVRVLTLPDGLDPADYLLKHSAESLLELAKTAPDALEFKMRRVCEGFDPVEETHRANLAIEQMLGLLSKVPRSSLIANDQFLMRRNQVLARLARRFMVNEDELRGRLRSLMDKASRVQRFDPGSSPARPRPDARGAAHESNAPTGPNSETHGAMSNTGSGLATSSGATSSAGNSSAGNSSAGNSSAAPLNTTAAADSRANRLTRPGDLSPVERELLELLVSAPNLAPMVLERVLPEWLESEAARSMLGAYHELELEGCSLQFDSVLVAMEDPSLKSLMVTLYEQAQGKQKFVKDTPEQRLRVLTQRMGQRQEEQQRRRQLLQFENGGLDDETELSLLSEFILQARQSHGLDDRQLLDESSEQKSTGPGLYDDLDVAENPGNRGAATNGSEN